MKFPTCILMSSAIGMAIAGPAAAAPFKFKPLVDARLRYEHVEQVPLTDDAEAVTLRARLGGELSNGPWSFLAEAEGTLAINEDYNSGVNGKALFPIVADPENIELNRIQVQYKGLPKTVVTVGRQRINLDDQRFVGSVGWRQNEQTFDAARIEWSGVKNLKVDLTYSWSARTIWGIDGFGARQQALSGDNFFGNLSYTTKIGTLTGFAYLIDEDEPAQVTLLRNSSQTYGARFAGAYPLSKAVKLSYVASYASQSDYAKNPVSYSADYYLGELGIEAKGFKLLGGYEVLGSDQTAAGAPGSVFAFQTPFATLHKFQGWADKFLTTPANGVQDAYGSLSYTKAKVGPFASISGTVAYHDYKSDKLSMDYGTEWNFQLLAKVKKYTFILKYADYNADAFATDTKKFWASVEWAF